MMESTSSICLWTGEDIDIPDRSQAGLEIFSKPASREEEPFSVQKIMPGDISRPQSWLRIIVTRFWSLLPLLQDETAPIWSPFGDLQRRTFSPLLSDFSVDSRREKYYPRLHVCLGLQRRRTLVFHSDASGHRQILHMGLESSS